jgi:hypothetical protein
MSLTPRTLAVCTGLASLLLSVAPGVHAVETASACEDGGNHRQDFDRDGRPDLVFGVADRKVGGKRSAGAVVVVQSSRGEVVLTRESLGLGAPRAGDRFGQEVGATTATACDALLITAPGMGRSGSLIRVVPSALGIGVDTRTDMLAPRLDRGAGFGTSTGPWPVRGSGWAIAAPRADVGRTRDAGAILRVVVPDDIDEPMRVTGRLSFASPGVPGRPRTDDRFGEVLAYSSIGVPRRDVDGRENAGVVLERRSGGFRVVREGDGAMPGRPTSGNRFGAALYASWMYGVPGANVNGKAGAGKVLVDDGGSWVTLHGDAVRGTPARSGDAFGSALSMRTHQVSDWGKLFIGVPGRDTARRQDVGAVATFEVNNEEWAARGRYRPLQGLDAGARAGSWFVEGRNRGVAGPGRYLLTGAPGEYRRGRADAGALVVVKNCYADQCGTFGMDAFGGTPRAGDRLGARPSFILR